MWVENMADESQKWRLSFSLGPEAKSVKICGTGPRGESCKFSEQRHTSHPVIPKPKGQNVS